jgi:hypothetical protein
MKKSNEDVESCNAFNLLFNQIKLLQKRENTLKHMNSKSLEKCHEEIKNLFAEAVGDREKEENTAKVS